MIRSNKPIPLGKHLITVQVKVDYFYCTKHYFVHNSDYELNKFIVSDFKNGRRLFAFDSFLLAKEACNICERITHNDPVEYKPQSQNPKTQKLLKSFKKQLKENQRIVNCNNHSY
jgi:hypothetical protein